MFLVIIPGAESKMEEGEEDPDWEMAVREMNKAQVQMMAEQEAKRKAAAEAAQKVADARVAEIEQKLEAERKKAEAEAEERRRCAGRHHTHAAECLRRRTPYNPACACGCCPLLLWLAAGSLRSARRRWRLRLRR